MHLLGHGRFDEHRGFNQRLRNHAFPHVLRMLRDHHEVSYDDLNDYAEARQVFVVEYLNIDTEQEALSTLFENVIGYQGHHSAVVFTQPRRPTWEFRIWNATRSAWRMNMFVGLSWAFTQDGFLTALADRPAPGRPRPGIERVAEALDDWGESDFSELPEWVLRQAHYIDNTDEVTGSTPFAQYSLAGAA
jgi:hypothetical protein